MGVPPQQREGFYAAIGRSELLDDERFQPFILDPEDRKELFVELRKTFETRTTAEWGDCADRGRLPVGTGERLRRSYRRSAFDDQRLYARY